MLTVQVGSLTDVWKDEEKPCAVRGKHQKKRSCSCRLCVKHYCVVLFCHKYSEAICCLSGILVQIKSESGNAELSQKRETDNIEIAVQQEFFQESFTVRQQESFASTSYTCFLFSVFLISSAYFFLIRLKALCCRLYCICFPNICSLLPCSHLKKTNLLCSRVVTGFCRAG